MKLCTACGEVKDLEEFRVRNNMSCRQSRRTYCIACDNARQKAYNDAHSVEVDKEVIFDPETSQMLASLTAGWGSYQDNPEGEIVAPEYEAA
jgi:hypothetical protein